MVFFADQKITIKLWKYNHRSEVEFGVSFRGPNTSLTARYRDLGIGGWELQRGKEESLGEGKRALGVRGME